MSSVTPLKRLRRLRRTPVIRTMLQEHDFKLTDLIHPLFIEEGITEPHAISTLPGIERLPESQLADEVEALYQLGVVRSCRSVFHIIKMIVAAIRLTQMVCWRG